MLQPEVVPTGLMILSRSIKGARGQVWPPVIIMMLTVIMKSIQFCAIFSTLLVVRDLCGRVFSK